MYLVNVCMFAMQLECAGLILQFVKKCRVFIVLTRELVGIIIVMNNGLESGHNGWQQP